MRPEPFDLRKLEALAAAATPAPWTADTAVRGDCVVFGPDGLFLANIESEKHWVPDPYGRKREVMFDVDRRDAEFIAAVRTDWEALSALARAGEQVTDVLAVVTAAMDCVSEILARWPDAETNAWLEPSTRALVAAVRAYVAPVVLPATSAPQPKEAEPIRQPACVDCGHRHRWGGEHADHAWRDSCPYDAGADCAAVPSSGGQCTAADDAYHRQCDKMLAHGEWCRLILGHKAPCDDKYLPKPIEECYQCWAAPRYLLDGRVQRHAEMHRQRDAEPATAGGTASSEAGGFSWGADASYWDSHEDDHY